MWKKAKKGSWLMKKADTSLVWTRPSLSASVSPSAVSAAEPRILWCSRCPGYPSYRSTAINTGSTRETHWANTWQQTSTSHFEQRALPQTHRGCTAASDKGWINWSIKRQSGSSIADMMWLAWVNNGFMLTGYRVNISQCLLHLTLFCNHDLFIFKLH